MSEIEGGNELGSLTADAKQAEKAEQRFDPKTVADDYERSSDKGLAHALSELAASTTVEKIDRANGDETIRNLLEDITRLLEGDWVDGEEEPLKPAAEYAEQLQSAMDENPNLTEGVDDRELLIVVMARLERAQ